MEKGGEEPATRATGGMCDRLLTFLAKNLSMGRMKRVAEGAPKNGGGAGGHPATEGGAEDHEDDDEFAIPIERADEFDFEFSGHGDGGHSTAATILGESAATARRDVPDPKVPAVAADVTSVAAAEPEAPAAVEETKARQSVTIKDDQPAAAADQQEGGGAATVERKKSLFRKRQASSAAGEEQAAGGAPRRSGLRPRMPRVPTNINERSSTFIQERRKGFGGGGGSTAGKPAPDK